MYNKWTLSHNRQLTKKEKSLIWQKPHNHIVSEAELRICREVKRNWHRKDMKITNILLEGDAGSGKTQLAKALSANFGLPYTKITCFADMDKSDVLGSILPIISEDDSNGPVSYKYYPSEIINAYENGWLLEIQEPTVIRDAAVLMALNSALEPGGSINLPTRIVHRHPDFIAVITTNRGYGGCRPLNEALRDRFHHCEKMDLPDMNVMVERAAAKTNCKDKKLLNTFAEVIITLDRTAKSNAIKGVAGMRTYFFWVDAVMQKSRAIDALYHKVIYKITTDPDEIGILEEALSSSGLIEEILNISSINGYKSSNDDTIEFYADGKFDSISSEDSESEKTGVQLRAAPESECNSSPKNLNKTIETYFCPEDISSDNTGKPIYHEINLDEKKKLDIEKKKFRKQLNREARENVKGSIHEKIGLIVHRPEPSEENYKVYRQFSSEIVPVVNELIRKTRPLLENEKSLEYSKNRFYGSKFNIENVASPDFRYFSKKRPPEEEPSLAVALRIDQSASMNANRRLDAAKKAAIAVYEFCEALGIPLLIYGDTADRTPKEKMSIYSYIDWDEPDLNDKHSLMNIKSLSNNRDGMALRILSEKLMKTPKKTKLLISLSDGQPKALPDYTDEVAKDDMKKLIREYSQKGIIFIAAAIGHDREAICDIYGSERFMDITDLKKLPTQLVQLIAKHL